MEYTFLPLDARMDRASFDCGEPSLNDYFHQYARQNHDKGLSFCTVIVAVSYPTIPLGYYTLSAAEISKASLPKKAAHGIPKYPVPAIRIGRLAVSHLAKGKGLGARLLQQALHTIASNKSFGALVVVVDALNDNAAKFYLKYGFLPLTNMPQTLFLPIATIRSACN
jgi:ribosomal protein S18 acetylase RimI-like enzyme